MAASVANSGTISGVTVAAAAGVIHTQTVPTGGAHYQFKFDVAACVGGDLLIFYLFTKVLSGGTMRTAYTLSVQHEQQDSIVYTPPMALTDVSSLRLDYEQKAGTARSIPWELIRLDA